MSVSRRQSSLACAALVCAAVTSPAWAIQFDLDFGGGIHGTLNSVVTAGAQVRMQDRDYDLLGKSNINPGVCATPDPNDPTKNAQACQGLFKDQQFPSRTLVAAPGAASNNADDGDWNYRKYHLTQAPVKAVQDLKMTWGDYGMFAKWYWFYDYINANFTEHHNNMLTDANYLSSGCTSPPPGGCNANAPPTGYPRTYGPGQPVAFKRTDGELLKQIGTNLQPFDLYLFGNIPLPGDHKITAKLGRQTVNWGESTVLVINSINQANPVNANNLTRVGFDLSELFVPTGKLFLSTELFENATAEAFYAYEWKPLEIPAPGSFYSFADVGTNNIGMTAGFNFSGPAEDPDRHGAPTNNPLSGLTPTTTEIVRLRDHNAKDQGQYGVAFKYFADWLNHGTQLGLYYMNYHSQLPYVSFYSTIKSCARQGGVHQIGVAPTPATFDEDATNGLELLQDCPDLPIFHAGGDPDTVAASRSDAVPLDHVMIQLEYPENIKLYGISFNTTVGDISMQGELAYRPKMPLQITKVDLAFLAMAPGLTNCSDPTSGASGTGCTGTNTGGPGVHPTSSDYTPYPGAPTGSCASGQGGYCDTFELAAGHADSSARSFPSFVGVYRGYTPGQFPSAYDNVGNFLGEGPGNPGYIRGWEYFDVYQFNLGGTYVQGATDNPIGADQVIWLFETGAQYVPGLPGLDTLQIEGPGAYYHASAGADGSMSGNFKQDCAGTPDCNNGADGLRFNPHQQDRDAYATKFSAGYAIVSLIRYESVFPGISFAPLTLFKHDVVGNSTDNANQFTRGRKQINLNFEIRYKEALSIVPGYNWFFGGKYNLQQDRDNAQMYIKYQF